MAKNPNKRQQQLARKKSKRKAKRAAMKTGSGSNVSLMQAAARAPVERCLIPEHLFEDGIGSIFLSRRLADGSLVTGVFLVDVYCLGVKDCFLMTVSAAELDERLAMQPVTYVEAPAACAHEILQGAVAFAQDLGLKPHKDYVKFEKLFGGIDPEDCDQVFEYGRDGRPLYIPGPNDGPRVVERITRLLGEG